MRTIPLVKKMDQHGFTLIEALVAMVILSIGIGALYSMQITSIHENAHAMSITSAANYGMEKIEELINTPFDDIEDLNEDGEDGINATSSPDYSEITDDQNYAIFVNVVEDKPVEGCKLVHVLVKDQKSRMSNTIVMQYIKEESI